MSYVPQPPAVNPAASEAPASPSEPFHFGPRRNNDISFGPRDSSSPPPAADSEPFRFGTPSSSPGPSWEDLMENFENSESPPAARQLGYSAPASFDSSDDEGINNSGPPPAERQFSFGPPASFDSSDEEIDMGEVNVEKRSHVEK